MWLLQRMSLVGPQLDRCIRIVPVSCLQDLEAGFLAELCTVSMLYRDDSVEGLAVTVDPGL